MPVPIDYKDPRYAESGCCDAGRQKTSSPLMGED